MKRILLLLLVLCMASGCAPLKENHLNNGGYVSSEGIVMNMRMEPTFGGPVRYYLLIKFKDGTAQEVMTDVIVFHQATLGCNVLLTGQDGVLFAVEAQP